MNNYESLLYLIRLGIGHSYGVTPDSFDWQFIKTNADKQGLNAIVIDGIEELPDSKRPPKHILLEWIGEVLQSYESRYVYYSRAIADMAGFYNRHGFKMMLLKGYACSLEWPKPEHRPCGDIDIWQFGQQKEADILLMKEKGVKIDSSHHHHTVFYWGDFMVENHYDFDNVHARKSNYEIEKYFKELGMDDSHFVYLYGEKVYVPSPNLHILFLLRHMLGHFASSNINVRQVLDWAFYVEKHTKEIDWNWFMNILDQFHMRQFFNCINGICVEDLGFDASIFHEVCYLPEIKEKVLKDILDPEFEVAEPQFFFSRLMYKYRRWQGNAWKQRLCYSESRWSAFIHGIWGHILKPSSL